MRAAGSVAVHGNMRNSPEAGHMVRARSRWYKVLRQGGGSAPGGAEPPQLEATGGEETQHPGVLAVSVRHRSWRVDPLASADCPTSSAT